MRKGEATRQFIVEQAAPIFNRRGYVGCSLSEIMAATGLEKGGIYRHFASKEELAAEAFDYAWSRAVQVRWAGVDELADPVEQLQRHVKNFTERTGFPGGCPVLNTAADADDGNPVLRERVRAALRSWRTRIARIVEEGQASGAIRPGMDPHAVAGKLIGALEGAILLSRIERSQEPLEQTHADLDAWLVRELSAPRRTRARQEHFRAQK